MLLLPDLLVMAQMNIVGTDNFFYNSEGYFVSSSARNESLPLNW
jgi:hypothetical protein